ncbi:DNA-binding protein RFX2-like isoform X3 [Clytia hemisphaerica]|uniref:RFX-type winged-helix domain-containing protein n=1 Tax=Clytia hemisphaerica TaxID=252671 RepID=A0A7M5TS07_9CNID
MGDQTPTTTKITAPTSVAMQKIASLPSLAASLISPAAVAKASISKPATSTASSTIGQQIALLNNSGANTNILIKTTKTNSSGQPTYVAISIPTQNTSTSPGQKQSFPLAIHQLKIKQQQQQQQQQTQQQDDEEKEVKAEKTAGYPSTDLGQSYTSDQASSQAMVSSFPYGAGGTGNESMYSQQSNLHTYMDSHGNASQNQMFQSYSAQGGHPGSMGLGVSPQAIGVAQQAQYLQPGQAASQRVPISHTTRASPITVQWLLENYETSDGVSLPRSTLYHHYLRHCAENKIDAVNAASFGKLIRSVFVGLKTRRLGTRGNSKYHYYGIRVKPNSPLARITDDTHVALRATPTSSKRSMGSNNYDEERRTEGAASNAEDSSALSAHQQYLGDVGDGLPEGPVIDLTEPLPEGLKKEDVITFGNYYRSHSEALLEVISTLQFDLVEALWQSFYKSPAAANKADNGTLDNNEFNITKNDLITFCNYKPVQVFIKETDYILYQKLVGVLVPDVLRAVPSALTQIVRNFAKSLENWLVGSMSEMPKEICNVKVAAVSAFSQTLRRYTSLNHLAQAARAVLQNSQQINQMWNDLNKVDFNNVQEQSSWVCQCDESLIAKLEQDFKQTLAQQHSLEQWAKWLESVVAMVLEPHQGQESYPKAARNFLLNWSFYSSMIIRDLTLRSAASFGSFHLIRLLYDEYMFYLIEHKVAAHTGKSPMSVMAECVGGMTSSSNGNQGNDDEDELDENSNDGLSALTGGDVLKAGANLTMSQINEGMEPAAKKLKPDHLG